MKKLELQQIIREEIRKALNEQKSNIELIGPDIDELLDAITFINTGVKTSKGLQPHSFGKNTLKALDSDGHSIGRGKFSIGVEPKTSDGVEPKTSDGVEPKTFDKSLDVLDPIDVELYIRQANKLLEDHGFKCKLYMTK